MPETTYNQAYRLTIRMDIKSDKEITPEMVRKAMEGLLGKSTDDELEVFTLENVEKIKKSP